MICANCGLTYHPYQGGGADIRKGQHYCSRECFLAAPFPLRPHIAVNDLQRAARQYDSQRAAAEALGVSYPQFRRAMAKFDLRGCFPDNGKVASSHW